MFAPSERYPSPAQAAFEKSADLWRPKIWIYSCLNLSPPYRCTDRDTAEVLGSTAVYRDLDQSV